MTAPVALSIRQPWAWAICAGLKDVENRSWSTPHRGRLLVHAAQQLDEHGLAALARLGIAPPGDLAFGAIIGEAVLLDCVRDSQSGWAAPGHVHWLVTNARLWPRPVRYPGRLRVFEVRLR